VLNKIVSISLFFPKKLPQMSLKSPSDIVFLTIPQLTQLIEKETGMSLGTLTEKSFVIGPKIESLYPGEIQAGALGMLLANLTYDELYQPLRAVMLKGLNTLSSGMGDSIYDLDRNEVLMTNDGFTIAFNGCDCHHYDLNRWRANWKDCSYSSPLNDGTYSNFEMTMTSPQGIKLHVSKLNLTDGFQAIRFLQWRGNYPYFINPLRAAMMLKPQTEESLLNLKRWDIQMVHETLRDRIRQKKYDAVPTMVNDLLSHYLKDHANGVVDIKLDTLIKNLTIASKENKNCNLKTELKMVLYAVEFLKSFLEKRSPETIKKIFSCLFDHIKKSASYFDYVLSETSHHLIALSDIQRLLLKHGLLSEESCRELFKTFSIMLGKLPKIQDKEYHTILTNQVKRFEPIASKPKKVVAAKWGLAEIVRSAGDILKKKESEVSILFASQDSSKTDTLSDTEEFSLLSSKDFE